MNKKGLFQRSVVIVIAILATTFCVLLLGRLFSGDSPTTEVMVSAVTAVTTLLPEPSSATSAATGALPEFNSSGNVPSNPIPEGEYLVSFDATVVEVVSFWVFSDMPQPPTVVGTCPINPVDMRPWCESYPECHGVEGAYWTENKKPCSYAIPWLANFSCVGCPNNCSGAACAATDSASYCASLGVTPQQPYYGYAYDVQTAGDATVYLPRLGAVEAWQVDHVVSINRGNWGYGVSLSATDYHHTYKMALLHLNEAMWPVSKVGEAIGTLYAGSGFTPHVHIELMIDGIVVKPEEYLCVVEK